MYIQKVRESEKQAVKQLAKLLNLQIVDSNKKGFGDSLYCESEGANIAGIYVHKGVIKDTNEILNTINAHSDSPDYNAAKEKSAEDANTYHVGLTDAINALPNVNTLEFKYSTMKNLPLEFLLFRNLTTLNIEQGSKTQIAIRELPAEIGTLEQLEVLRLPYCGLTDLPDSLTNPNLKVIDLSYNNLKNIPEVLLCKMYFATIQQIILTGNPLAQGELRRIINRRGEDKIIY